MSVSAVKHDEVPPRLVDASEKQQPDNRPKAYRGFVGGVFSGIAKLSGMCLRSGIMKPDADTEDSGTSVRHHQGPPTDHRQVAIQGAVGLSATDIEK